MKRNFKCFIKLADAITKTAAPLLSRGAFIRTRRINPFAGRIPTSVDVPAFSIVRTTGSKELANILNGGNLQDVPAAVINARNPMAALERDLPIGGHRSTVKQTPVVMSFNRGFLTPKQRTTQTLLGTDLDLWSPDRSTRRRAYIDGATRSDLRRDFINDNQDNRVALSGAGFRDGMFTPGPRALISPENIQANNLPVTAGLAERIFRTRGGSGYANEMSIPYSEAYLSGEVPAFGKNGVLHRVILQRTPDIYSSDLNTWLREELARRGIESKEFMDPYTSGLYLPENWRDTISPTRLLPMEGETILHPELLKRLGIAENDIRGRVRDLEYEDVWSMWDDLRKRARNLKWSKNNGEISEQDYRAGVNNIYNDLFKFYGIDPMEARQKELLFRRHIRPGAVDFNNAEDAVNWVIDGSQFAY